MKGQMLLVLSLVLAIGSGYPIRCVEIGGDSALGTVDDCDVQHDPFPFHYTATIKLKKNVKWAGIDDVSIMYANPDDSVEGNCTTTIPVPTNYSKGSNVTM